MVFHPLKLFWHVVKVCHNCHHDKIMVHLVVMRVATNARVVSLESF